MIGDYLTKQERLGCIKAGALAYAGMLDAEYGSIQQVKEAAALDTVDRGASVAKSLAVLAAVAGGVPIGVFSHIVGRRIAGKRLREEELKEKIRLYQTAADEMASGLSGGEL